jgi:hypothetical protein
LLLLVAAAACYVGIVVVRQGPPPGGDTGPLTSVTSDLSSGDLRAAAANTSLPNPPGYALLASPLVASLRSLIGSPVWCTTAARAAPLRLAPSLRADPTFATDVGECGAPHRRADGTVGPPLPPWYRSQGVLGVFAWLVLAVGSLALLRAAGSDTFDRVAALLVFLAFLPAASSAIVQLYHPQDIVSLGLALGGLAQTLKRRWVIAGLLLGGAIVTKQFAILVLLPAVAVAPGTRARLRLLLPAAGVFAAGFLPFLVSAPHATIDNFSGVSGGGAQAGATLLTLLGVTGDVASAIARDAPVAFAIVVCLWARHRLGPALGRPQTLVGLSLACVGSRLVFESVLFPYYLLATSVMFFMLDLVARRSPHRSLAWSAAAAFFVALRPGNRAVDAFGTLILAVLGVLGGMAELTTARPEHDVPPPGLPVAVTAQTSHLPGRDDGRAR